MHGTQQAVTVRAWTEEDLQVRQRQSLIRDNGTQTVTISNLCYGEEEASLGWSGAMCCCSYTSVSNMSNQDLLLPRPWQAFDAVRIQGLKDKNDLLRCIAIKSQAKKLPQVSVRIY